MADAALLEGPGSSGAAAGRGGAEDNIQVLVRVRPPNAREMEQVRLRPPLTPPPRKTVSFPPPPSPPETR